MDRPGQRRWYALADTFDSDETIRWVSDLGEQEFEVVSLAVCPTSVVVYLSRANGTTVEPQNTP